MHEPVVKGGGFFQNAVALVAVPTNARAGNDHFRALCPATQYAGQLFRHRNAAGMQLVLAGGGPGTVGHAFPGQIDDGIQRPVRAELCEGANGAHLAIVLFGHFAGMTGQYGEFMSFAEQ